MVLLEEKQARILLWSWLVGSYALRHMYIEYTAFCTAQCLALPRCDINVTFKSSVLFLPGPTLIYQFYGLKNMP